MPQHPQGLRATPCPPISENTLSPADHQQKPRSPLTSPSTPTPSLPASPLGSTFKTDPDSDPLAATTISSLEYYSSLLMRLPCFPPCLVYSLFSTGSQRDPFTTQNQTILLCPEPYHGSPLRVKANALSIASRTRHLLPSPPSVHSLPSSPLWPPCSLLFFK